MSIGALMLNLTAFSQCSDLFFSEYIEGSSNNKALEIYNPTNSSVDLSNYSVFMINNGGSPNNIAFQLYGTLDAYSVFVIGNDAAVAAITGVSDTIKSYNSVVHFNGDDAVCLIKGTDTIDVIGQRWNDPGSSWTVGSGATRDYTLVRKSTVKGGQLNWATGAGEWDVYAQNTYSYLGSHTSDCYVPANAEVSFTKTNVKAGETDGMMTINVSISNPSATTATTVDVVVKGGDAANGTDYTLTSPTTVTFAAGSSADESVTITITDNSMSAADKQIILALRNASAGTDIGNDSNMTVTIENDDYLISTILGVRGNTADWTPALNGQKVEIKGIVYGIDLDGNTGLSFTIIDTTAGMNIFNFSDVSDYVVTEGDEITVRGEITSYNGLTEVFADSIKVNSTGNTLKAPKSVKKPSEETESDFIKVRKVWIADTTTVWPNNGNVMLTNGTDSFQIRIDRDLVDIVGQAVIGDTMDITGLGGQFDNSAFPLDAGYQIFPRRLSDIAVWDNSSVRDFTLIANVYPNPTNGLIHISAFQPIIHVEITDALGHVVLSQSVSKELQTSLELQNVSAGVYFILIHSENASSVKRLVVE